ncbi:ABC transporter substrate-binding protein [Glutamicibacter arilaitensis]|uniref:ABC transporter substrate-binding protein n=1 Tax=Glutamicibacter arilaitensis TaxID=256701 RepID=UPI003850C2F9
MKLNKKNTLKVGGLLTVGILTLSACGGNESEATAGTGSGEMPAVTIAIPPSIHGLGPATAYQEGLFEEAGIEVSIETIQSGSEGAALIAGGDAQFALFSYDNAINSVIEGHNNVMTIPITTQDAELSSDPHAAGSIVVDANGDIESLQDLEGQRIGTSVLGGEAYLNAYQVLENEGVDVSTIEWIQVPGPQHVSSVLQGQVAAAVTPEPNLSIAMVDGSVRPIAAVSGALPNAPSFGFASDRTWAEENPEVIEVVRDVIFEVNTRLNNDPALVAESIKEYMGLDDEVAEMVKAPRFAEEPLSVEILEPIAARLVAFNQISENEMPNLEEVIFSAE